VYPKRGSVENLLLDGLFGAQSVPGLRRPVLRSPGNPC